METDSFNSVGKLGATALCRNIRFLMQVVDRRWVNDRRNRFFLINHDELHKQMSPMAIVQGICVKRAFHV